MRLAALLSARPTPDPSTRRAAVVLAVLTLVSFAPHARELGFYSDDWVFMEKLSGEGGAWGAAKRLLAETTCAHRTLQAVFWPLLYRLAGSEPWPYHALYRVQEWAIALLFFLWARRCLGSASLALAAACLATVLPITPATHYWASIVPQGTALALTLAAMLVHWDWLDDRRPAGLALSMGFYAASLLLYESSSLFAIAAQSAALLSRRLSEGRSSRDAALDVARQVLAPFGTVLLAGAAWQKLVVPGVFGAGHPKSLTLSPAKVAGTFLDAGASLGPELWHLIKMAWGRGTAVVAADSSKVLLVLSVAWLVRRLAPDDGEPASAGLGRAALVGAAGLLGAYLPYALGGYSPQVYGLLSRSNGTAAFPAALLLAAALQALGLSASRRLGPRAGEALRAAGLAALLGAFVWTNWFTAATWAEAFKLEKDILAKATVWVQRMPFAKTVVLVEAPYHHVGAAVFDSHWGFNSALRLATKRKDLAGMIRQPMMVTEARGLVDYGHPSPIVYPYDGLYLYNYKTNEMLRPGPAKAK